MKRFMVLLLCLYLAVIGMGVAGHMLIGGARLAALMLSVLLLVVAMRYATTRRVRVKTAADFEDMPV